MPKEAAKTEKRAEKAAPAAKKKGGSKLIIIIAAVVLLGGGGAAAFLLKGKAAKAAPAAEKTVSDEVVGDAKDGGAAAKSDTTATPTPAAKEGGKEEGGEGKEGKATPEPTPVSLIYKFDEKFIVNLQDPHGRFFLQTGLQLEAASPEALKKIEANVAPLRDAIIMLLSSKTQDDLNNVMGKERFKRELMIRMDGILEPKSVKSVYITDMLISQ